MFKIKTDIPNMPETGKVKFENSLHSLYGTFNEKTLLYDPCLNWNGVFYNERVEKFQVFTNKINFPNTFASDEVRF